MGEIRKSPTGAEAKVICDSVSPDGIRLTTVRLHYWRPIHSELMTHRVFSRNARSSRAVPVTTLLKEEPYIPEFGSNKPGMQAGDKLDPESMQKAKNAWLDLIGHTRSFVQELHELGVHKQWANRPLEWFGWIDVLVTSTDWANWDALRDHSAAAPEIHELARLRKEAFHFSQPELLEYGEWHLPYVSEEEKWAELGPRTFRSLATSEQLQKLKILSAARCARISYKPFDGEADYDREVARYQKLVEEEPVHASPTEHQATPDMKVAVDFGKGQHLSCWANPELQGNFVGWIQARKMILGEAILDPHHAPM